MRILILVSILLVSGCATTGGGQLSQEAVIQSRLLYQKALVAYRDRQLMEAFESVSSAIEKNPANARAWELFGLVNQRLGRLDTAEQAFERAIQLSPNDPAILNNYGSFLCDRKEWQAAQKQFSNAANNTANPQPEIAWTNAGLCARRSGNELLAKTLLEKAIQQDPGQPTALYQLALISLDQGKPVEANTWLQQYLNHAVHTPKTLLLGARIEYALNNSSGVESYKEKLRTAFPNSPERKEAETLRTETSSVPRTVHGLEWIRQRDPSHFTVQIDSHQDINEAIRLAQQLPPPSAILQQNDTILILQGDYNSLKNARRAIGALKSRIPNSEPWVRDYSSLQKLLD